MYNEAQLLQQIATAREHGDVADPRVLKACQLLADWYVSVGRLKDAASRWTKLIDELDQTQAAKRLDKAVARVRLADVQQQLSQLEPAQSTLWEALDLIRAEPDPPRIDLAFVLNQLAEVSFALGRQETSLTASKNAMALLVGVVADDHSELIRTRNNLAAIHGLRGEISLAERLLRQNLKALSRAYGERDPSLVVPYQNLAVLYRQHGRMENAESLLDRAHEIASQRLGATHLLTVRGLSLRADLQEFAGDLSAAERTLREVLRLRRETLSVDDPSLARSLTDLGTVLCKRGKPREAEPLLDEALRIYQGRFGQQHPQTASIQCALSRVYFAAGRLANAERAAQEALGVQQLTLHVHDPALLETYRQLAAVAAARRDPQAARQAIEHIQELLPTNPNVSESLRFSLALSAAEIEIGFGDPTAGEQQLALVRTYRALPTVPVIDRVTCRRLEAELELARGRLDDAHEHCQRAYAWFQKLPNHPAADAAKLAGVAAQIALQRCEYAAAVKSARQELLFREKLEQQESPVVLPAWVHLADAELAQEHFAEAEAALLRALSIAERAYGVPLAFVSGVVERLGRLQILQRNFDAFRPWMRRSIQLLEEAESDADPSACEEWVEMLRSAGQMDQANELTDQLFELRNRQSHVLGDLW